MALLFLEGFDIYADGDDVAKKWASASLSTLTSSGRFGTKAASASVISHILQKNLNLGNKTTLIIGFAFYLGAGTPSYSSTYPFIKIMDESDAIQVRVHMNSSFGFVVYNGAGTLLGSSASSVYQNSRWHYFEVKTVIHDTTGSVEIRLDEATILNLTSKDTKYGSAYADRFKLYGINGIAYNIWDDFYVDDTNFQGNVHVKTFRPDSDGNSSDFTRSTGSNDYECVDEEGSNEDTDYIYSDTLNHKSIFGITTGALGTVSGVQVNCDCRIDQAGTRKITPICRSNSVDYDGIESPALAANYKYETSIWETDPDDSNPWTQTKLEAAEFGLEITT